MNLKDFFKEQGPKKPTTSPLPSDPLKIVQKMLKRDGGFSRDERRFLQEIEHNLRVNNSTSHLAALSFKSFAHQTKFNYLKRLDHSIGRGQAAILNRAIERDDKFK